MDLARLREVFAPKDLEWRLQSAGKSQAGKIWALALVYVTNRAIMNRLDDVCGPENWQNRFKAGPAGGVICGLGVQVSPGVWVWKWDGAENTGKEGGEMGIAVKGGLSGSMKRAAVQWGIGRYLYDIEETFANIHERGKLRGRLPEKKGGDTFQWDPPELPPWALPDAPKQPEKRQAMSVQKDLGEPTKTATKSKARATAPQLELIDRMIRSHVITDEERERINARILKGITKEFAAEYIDWITAEIPARKAAEKEAEDAAAAPALAEGDAGDDDELGGELRYDQ